MSDLHIMNNRTVTIDGNEAAAYVAYKTNEVIAIYHDHAVFEHGNRPDAWAAAGKKNFLWGMTPVVREMQSRRRRGGSGSWRAANRLAGDHLHRHPGSAC